MIPVNAHDVLGFSSRIATRERLQGYVHVSSPTEGGVINSQESAHLSKHCGRLEFEWPGLSP